MFQHILVPVDGTAYSEQAIPVAAHIAQTTGASITLIYISRPSSDYLIYPNEFGILPEVAREVRENNMPRYLQRLSEQQTLQGIETHTQVITTNATVPVTLLESSELQHIDLIVMCSHVNMHVRHFIFGSVAQQVARRSAVPVLVLHKNEQGNIIEKDPDLPFRILVGLDGSALAETALAPAAELSAALSKPRPGKLELICVLPSNNHGDVEEEFHEARAYLEQIAGKLRRGEMNTTPVQVYTFVRHTNMRTVADTIQDAAKYTEAQVNHPADAIALATHGRNGLSRWLEGSVTEHILEHTTLPVLVIHQPTNEENHTQTSSSESEIKKPVTQQ